MIRWLKRLRQRPTPLTVREIELLARENQEARRQPMADPPLQVFSVTPPWMPLTSMPRTFLRRRSTSAVSPSKQRKDNSLKPDEDLGESGGGGN